MVDNPEGVQFSASGAATIDATGLATAGTSAGSATITASFGGLSDSATLTVEQALPVLTTLSVTPNPQTVQADIAVVFQVSGEDQFGDPFPLLDSVIEWTSSNPSVATVDATGEALGKAEGNATITATVGTVSGSALLNVVAAPSGSTGGGNDIGLQNGTELQKYAGVGSASR
jgi:hypothetical protein